jgi:hypothetical protein
MSKSTKKSKKTVEQDHEQVDREIYDMLVDWADSVIVITEVEPGVAKVELVKGHARIR